MGLVSRITAIAFAASFSLLSSGAGSAAILLFTAAVVLGWAWLTAVSAKLYGGVGQHQTHAYETATNKDGSSQRQ